MSSYSVNTQKHLAEELGIAANNISGWVQRNSVPGDAFVKCSLDTGADLHWLVTGEFANASFDVTQQKNKLKGKALLDKILESGGKAVLRRMLDAYGFTTQKELGDLLGISSATISTWIRRDFFPGDIVVACALDTGVSLDWLATGSGRPVPDPSELQSSDFVTQLKKFSINTGALEEVGIWFCDKNFIGSEANNYAFIEKNQESWVVDFNTINLGNGNWLISVDGIHDVYDVTRIPGGIIKLQNNNNEFQCNVSDVVCVGQVKKTIMVN